MRSEAAVNLRKTREQIRMENASSFEAKLQRVEVQLGSVRAELATKLQVKCSS